VEAWTRVSSHFGQCYHQLRSKLEDHLHHTEVAMKKRMSTTPIIAICVIDNQKYSNLVGSNTRCKYCSSAGLVTQIGRWKKKWISLHLHRAEQVACTTIQNPLCHKHIPTTMGFIRSLARAFKHALTCNLFDFSLPRSPSCLPGL
jgi:hypothetical protein